jgi:Ca2+/H+ antiporter, TMEM165/GDT1 family
MTTSTVLLALAVFGACAVESVEALTLVLAAGSTRGWRSAYEGAASAVVILAVLVLAVGVPLVHYVPIDVIRVVIGGLLLILGLGWLRKAILRASGHVALHDEDAIYARTVAELNSHPLREQKRDGIGFVVAFKGVLLEGLEIVLIVLSLGVSSHHLGLAALMAVGALVARQLSEVPENSLKFVVGIMLSSFGVFWIGEGVGLSWPGNDLAILACIGGFLVLSYGLVRWLRSFVEKRSGVDTLAAEQ